MANGKSEGGGGQNLTFTDKGYGMGKFLTFADQREGGGGLLIPILADVICELSPISWCQI